MRGTVARDGRFCYGSFMRRWTAGVVLALAGCNSGDGPDPAVTPTKLDEATLGTVRGTVRFEGAVPEPVLLPVGGNAECSALHASPPASEEVLVRDGRLQNAFVYVKRGLDKYVFDWPRTPVTISNEKCIYRPRVAGAQVHQPIRFVNGDPTLHNVHVFASKGEDNYNLIGKGSEAVKKFREPDVMVRLKCDIHPWMVGYVGVVPHPYFAVTGPDGAFELKGVPPGEYTIEAWHEKYGTKTGKIKLDPRGVAEVEFVFRP